MSDEVKIVETTEHQRHDEFIMKQLVKSLPIGYTIELRVLDDKGNPVQIKNELGEMINQMSYTAQFIDCHCNFVIQDKGDMKPETIP